MVVLRAVADRVMEYLNATKFLTEPMRACRLGVPGAGKSKCIKWLKRLLTDCFGYEDGVHFQALAPQNTMAAMIGWSTKILVLYFRSITSRYVRICSDIDRFKRSTDP